MTIFYSILLHCFYVCHLPYHHWQNWTNHSMFLKARFIGEICLLNCLRLRRTDPFLSSEEGLTLEYTLSNLRSQLIRVLMFSFRSPLWHLIDIATHCMMALYFSVLHDHQTQLGKEYIMTGYPFECDKIRAWGILETVRNYISCHFEKLTLAGRNVGFRWGHLGKSSHVKSWGTNDDWGLGPAAKLLAGQTNWLSTFFQWSFISQISSISILPNYLSNELWLRLYWRISAFSISAGHATLCSIIQVD
jgi:hypothetical protein